MEHLAEAIIIGAAIYLALGTGLTVLGAFGTRRLLTQLGNPNAKSHAIWSGILVWLVLVVGNLATGFAIAAIAIPLLVSYGVVGTIGLLAGRFR
jgi:hypothetical protein